MDLVEDFLEISKNAPCCIVSYKSCKLALGEYPHVDGAVQGASTPSSR